MKSKKVLIAIIAVIATLAILGGTFAGLWFFTDVFNFLKPANDVFSNQIEKAFNLENVKFTDYSELLKDYKEISEKPSKTKLNMTANLNISELDSEVQNTINKSKITIESNVDSKAKKSQNKIGLYSNNSEILTLDLVTNNSKIGIGCTDLYDKYLTISSEDMLNYIKENSSEEDIEELELLLNNISNTNIDPYELLYISENDLKHFDETYRNCLTTLISKDCYTSEKDVEVSVDGSDVKTTAYYLTLTGKDTYKFISDLTNQIKDDSVITKIITEKANLILGSENKISENDVKELISQIIDSLMEELEDIKDEDEQAIQVAVYSKGTKPVRIEFNIAEDVEELDDKKTLLSIELADNKEIYTIYQDEKAYLVIENKYTKNEKDEKAGTITAKMSGMSLGTLTYEIIEKNDESKLNLSLNIPLAQVSGEINLSTKGNYKKEDVQFDGSFKFKYKTESVEIKFDGTTEFGNVSIPDLTSSNSTDVLNLSETEMKTELTNILQKASEVLPKRLKLIGINIDAEDILPSTSLNNKVDLDNSLNTITTEEEPAA